MSQLVPVASAPNDERMPISLNLLKAARRGNEDALSEIYNLLMPDILRAVRSFGVHVNDREDVAQELCLKVFACVHRFDAARGDFRPYVLSTIYLYLKNGRCRPKRLHFLPSGVPFSLLEPANGSSHTNHVDEIGYTTTAALRGIENRDHTDSNREANELVESLPAIPRSLVKELVGMNDSGEPESLRRMAAKRQMSVGEVQNILSRAFAQLRERAS